MPVTVTMPTETARICVPALRRALRDAESRAAAAGIDSTLGSVELERAVAIDCLIAALNRAIIDPYPAESDAPAGHSELATARAMLGAP